MRRKNGRKGKKQIKGKKKNVKRGAEEPASWGQRSSHP